MKLKAKIKPMYLDLILNGAKNVEMRSLETITLNDGTREHTLEIESAFIEEGLNYWNCFPDLLTYGKPVIFLRLGEEVKK